MICKSGGDVINWNEGMNVTVRKVKKGKKRITKKKPSFFDLFDPITTEVEDAFDEAISSLENQCDIA